jgi:GNAT superfamily N-acetyltransferase
MQIEPLRHHLGLVGEIANTLNQSWGDLPPWSTTDKIRDRLLAGTGDADFPRVLVALDESGTFAATGSVKLYELPSRPAMVHWVGEIFVRPEHRGKGLGSRVTQALSEYAFARGVQALYLYTPDQQSLYARLGWAEVSTATVNHEVVSIMVLSGGPSSFRAEPHSQD